MEALVRRHGPMVWGVCCRILSSHHDAEDAFQATVLILVRKAGSIVPREKVANWLYGVAFKTAHRAKSLADQQRSREGPVMDIPGSKATQQDRWLELLPFLDEELKRLPDKYRIPIILCDLKGKTRKEAARQLGWPEGTVAGRLAHGRTLLAKRLARHGQLFSGGALAIVLSQNAASACVPVALLDSTMKATNLVAAGNAVAPGAIPATVAALTDGVLNAMKMTKLKIVMAVLLVVSLIGLGAGVLAHQASAVEHARIVTPTGENESPTGLPLIVGQPPKADENEKRNGARPATDQITCRLEIQPKVAMSGDESLLQLLPGQELLPVIWLRNDSKQTLTVPFDFDIRFRIVGPDGKAMPGTALALKPLPKGERTIAPGKEERFGYDCEFRLGFLHDRAASYALTQPGKYSIEVAVTSVKDEATPAHLWTGTIHSAPVAIAIQEVEMGPEVGGLRLGLASHLPGKGGFPMAVLLKNTGRTPIAPTWDPNQMLHLDVTGPTGETVGDNFPTVDGTSGTLTLQPGEIFCQTHSLNWAILKSDKAGAYDVSLKLNVSTGKKFEMLLLKANPLRLTRTPEKKPDPKRDPPAKDARNVQPSLRVLAEPFLFQGSYYLKLSQQNPGDKPVMMNGSGDPARTTAKLFTVLADGKESTYRPVGAYGLFSGSSSDKRELAPRSQHFSGIVLLAGSDKGRLCDGYTTRFDLAAGEHEIEVFANNMTAGLGAIPAKFDKSIASATFKVTIPAKLESAADQNVPKTEDPLRFTLTTHHPDPNLVHVTIYVANESTDLWHFPYRGETMPAHRSNWYQLEVDGKIVKPTWNEHEHQDRAGKREIPPMQRRFAHTFKIVSEKAKDRKFDKNDYYPLYVLPEGEHTLRVIPSPLWAEPKMPVPVAASIRISLPGPKP